MKQLLTFQEVESKGKTKKFQVYSTHSDDFLGTIHWRAGWRCYVMSYESDIDMSSSCNIELTTFMENLELKRIANLKEKKNV